MVLRHRLSMWAYLRCLSALYTMRSLMLRMRGIRFRALRSIVSGLPNLLRALKTAFEEQF